MKHIIWYFLGGIALLVLGVWLYFKYMHPASPAGSTPPGGNGGGTSGSGSTPSTNTNTALPPVTNPGNGTTTVNGVTTGTQVSGTQVNNNTGMPVTNPGNASSGSGGGGGNVNVGAPPGVGGSNINGAAQPGGGSTIGNVNTASGALKNTNKGFINQSQQATVSGPGKTTTVTGLNTINTFSI